MEPDLSRTRRCPACAAAVRPGAPWCTQCYAELGGAQLSEAADEQAALVPAPRTPDTASAASPTHGAPPAPSGPGTWPCTACATPNPFDRDYCGGCATPFLADLSGDGSPLLVLPVVGDVARLSRGQRAMVGLGVSSAAVVVTAVLGLLLR